MHDTLYQYLILYKHLSLPGIGTIQLEKTSAEFDYENKVFKAPAYTFKIDSGQDKPSKKLFDRLSKMLNVTDWEAIRMLNDFSYDLKNKISSAGEAAWLHVGTLHRDGKGNITLDSGFIQLDSEMPVLAEKVIREKAHHTLLVGEMEKDSMEMEELLHEPAVKKDYGWIIAIIITVLSFIFVGWHLSEKGMHPASAGNQSFIYQK